MSKSISGENAPSQFKYIGKPRGTIDAPEKLKGQARYTADLQLPGMLHLRSVDATSRVAEDPVSYTHLTLPTTPYV